MVNNVLSGIRLFLLVFLARLLLLLVVLLALANVISQDAYLVVLVLVEIESISTSKSNLEEIVVQAFFADANLYSSVLQGEPVHFLTSLFLESCIVLPPLDHLIDYIADPTFLSSAALVGILLFSLLVFPLLHHRLVHFLRHEFVNQRYWYFVGLDNDIPITQILSADDDVLVDRVVSAVDIDLSLLQQV